MNENDTADESEWKQPTKAGLGEEVLLAFAYGFPGSDSKIIFVRGYMGKFSKPPKHDTEAR